eukprot:3515162-Pyramimonas_sp.AAC.2
MIDLTDDVIVDNANGRTTDPTIDFAIAIDLTINLPTDLTIDPTGMSRPIALSVSRSISFLLQQRWHFCALHGPAAQTSLIISALGVCTVAGSAARYVQVPAASAPCDTHVPRADRR